MICHMPHREELSSRPKGKSRGVLRGDSKANPHAEISFSPHDDPSKVVAVIRRGVAAGMYQWLKESLDVSDQRLSNVVRISQRTVKRRLGEGRFHPDESERLVRVARLTERTKEVFEDLERACEWLKSPQFALGGKYRLNTPIQSQERRS